MAQANIVDARYVRVWLGTAPGAPDAILLCAMDRKGFNQSLNTSDVVVPDCDDPLAVAPTKRTAISKDCTIAAAGYYEPERFDDMRNFFDSSASGNVCFEIFGGGNPGWYSGKFFMNTFNLGGDTAGAAGYITTDLGFQNDGDWAWTPAP